VPKGSLRFFLGVTFDFGGISPVAVCTTLKATCVKSLRVFGLDFIPNMIAQHSRKGYGAKFQTEPLPVISIWFQAT